MLTSPVFVLMKTSKSPEAIHPGDIRVLDAANCCTPLLSTTFVLIKISQFMFTLDPFARNTKAREQSDPPIPMEYP